MYQSAFYTIGVESRVPELLPIAIAALVVNLLPTAGAAALFVDDAAKREKSPSRTAAGLIWVHVADFGIFMFVLSIGFVYLFIRHALKLYEIIRALLVFNTVEDKMNAIEHIISLNYSHICRKEAPSLQRGEELRLVLFHSIDF
jgi:hypothetical protein